MYVLYAIKSIDSRQISASCRDCATSYKTDKSHLDSRQVPEPFFFSQVPRPGLPPTQTPILMTLGGSFPKHKMA
jgi:hypothetical protein